MSKREALKVEAFPPFRPEEMYEAIVMTLRLQKRLRVLAVGVQLIGGEQEGRAVEWHLPIPVRPTGLTARFLVAVGMDIHVGAAITPAEAIGRRLRVCFDRVAGEVQPIAFRSVERKDEDHAPAQ